MNPRDHARAYAEWIATPEVAGELAAIRADRAACRQLADSVRQHVAWYAENPDQLDIDQAERGKAGL